MPVLWDDLSVSLSVPLSALSVVFTAPVPAQKVPFRPLDKNRLHLFGMKESRYEKGEEMKGCRKDEGERKG